MRKINFNFRQWWHCLYRWVVSLFRPNRPYVVANLSNVDLSKSSFKSPEEALEFLRKDAQKSREQYECWLKMQKEQQTLEEKTSTDDVVENIETIEAEVVVPEDCVFITKSNLPKIKEGMIWYEDDTCSWRVLSHKKVKAVIELIDGCTIYGDLTASDLQVITEREFDCEGIKEYIKNFYYPCRVNEKIIVYTIEQMSEVYSHYNNVRGALRSLRTAPRTMWQYTVSKRCNNLMWFMHFDFGLKHAWNEDIKSFIRPVLALTLHDKDLNVAEFIPMTRENYLKIRVGMIWYEDNSCSFERIQGKKVKAVIEMVDGNKIYGDLTASELQCIEEKKLNWYDVEVYIKDFSYSCSKYEKIVWYNKEQLAKVYEGYGEVKDAFDLLERKCRAGDYWSLDSSSMGAAYSVSFVDGKHSNYNKFYRDYVRPVLCLEL